MSGRQRQRGSALIETALAMLLLVSTFGGTFELGYAIYVYHTLVNAVQEGARYAAIRPYDSNDATPSPAFLTAVQNVVAYGNASGSGSPVLPGLSRSNIHLLVGTDENGPAQMTVTISGFTVSTFLRTIHLDGKPAVTFPYFGFTSDLPKETSVPPLSPPHTPDPHRHLVPLDATPRT